MEDRRAAVTKVVEELARVVEELAMSPLVIQREALIKNKQILLLLTGEVKVEEGAAAGMNTESHPV